MVPQMSEAPGETGWVVGGVGAAIGALATAVATLFKINEGKNAQAIVELKDAIQHANKRFDESDKKHDECQKDRENLRIEMARLTVMVEMQTERDKQ
jgi:hypothetical protein